MGDFGELCQNVSQVNWGTLMVYVKDVGVLCSMFYLLS